MDILLIGLVKGSSTYMSYVLLGLLVRRRGKQISHSQDFLESSGAWASIATGDGQCKVSGIIAPHQWWEIAQMPRYL